MLEAHDLTVRYRHGRTALDGLSWQITPTSRTVLLGPNGAGKSTLLSVLSGSLTPQAGRVAVDGAALPPRTLARRVARMPQHVSAIPRLSCAEQVAYAGWLGGLPEPLSRQQALPALLAVGLEREAATRASALSGGQLRRLGLAETLVRGTSYVLLDEPTAGLDPQERARFREVLSCIEDVAFVVATHETHDISEVFDTVCVMRDGRFLYAGPVEQLVSSTGATTLEAAYIALMTAGGA